MSPCRYAPVNAFNRRDRKERRGKRTDDSSSRPLRSLRFLYFLLQILFPVDIQRHFELRRAIGIVGNKSIDIHSL